LLSQKYKMQNPQKFETLIPQIMELQMLELGVDLMLRRRLPSEKTPGMDDVEDGLRATRPGDG
jgi:hypothetical protein